MTVRRVRLGDVLRLSRSLTSVDESRSYRQIGVRGFGRGIFEYPPVTGAELGKLRFFDLEPNRLVVSNIKGWEGAVDITSEDERGRIASNRFLTYAPDASVSLRYLRHCLVADKGVAALSAASPGSADRNRTLSIKNFETIEIPLPSFDEQRRIADHLDAVERRVAAARKIQDFDWRASLPAFIDREFDRVGLPQVPVFELCRSGNRTIHPGDDPAPASEFVGLENVQSHTGLRTGSKPVGGETGRKLRFEPGELTFGYLRPYLNKVWVADRHGLCSVEQYVLRPGDGVDAELLGFALRAGRTLSAAIEATHSLSLPRLRLALLQGFAVPDVRQSTSDLLERLQSVQGLVEQLAAKTEHRTRLLQSILPAARNEIFNAIR